MRYRLFMVLYWAMMISVNGMYSLYIVVNNFSKMEISVTVTLFMISALLGQNVLGYITDKVGNVKKVLLPTLSMGVLIAMGLMFTKQHWHITALITLWGFFLYGTVPLSEAWCIGMLTKLNEQKSFGKIRGFGSISYAIAGVVLGFILEKLGWSYYYWYIIITVLFALTSIYIIRDKGDVALIKIKGGKASGENGVSIREAYDQIKKIRQLKEIIIIVFIYIFVIKGIYSYYGVLISDFGGGALSLGFTYLFDAGPEFVTFFLASRLLAKYNSKWLILAAFILQIIRLGLILIFNSALAIIILGVMSGLGFGMLAAAYKTYIYEIAPEKYKISCLSLSESIIGFSGVLSAPVFGFIIMSFGGNAAIAMGLVIYIAATLFIIKSIRTRDKLNKDIAA